MLSRRWIVNGLLILAILLVALVGYRLEAPSETVSRPPPAGNLKSDIVQIEIETGKTRLSLAKDADGWKFLEPVQWPADRGNIERLLDLVDTRKSPPLKVEGTDLATLGLDNPLAKLRLGDVRVSFGVTNSIGERRYTMIDSELFLLSDRHLPFILQGLSGFVDRRLLPPRFGLTSLALPDLELRRDENGAWRTAEGDDIDAQRLQELAGNWQSLEATRIGAFEDSRPVRAAIVADLSGGGRQDYLLLSIDPEIVIANPALGLQYHFRRALYGSLISPYGDENPA